MQHAHAKFLFSGDDLFLPESSLKLLPRLFVKRGIFLCIHKYELATFPEMGQTGPKHARR
jgi:hypothetical protein